MSLHQFFGNLLEPLAYLLYLFAVVLYAKKRQDKALLPLLLYYAMASALMLASTVMVEIEGGDTIWLYNVHAVITALLPGLYFRNLFQSRTKKQFSTVLIVATTGYLLVKNLVLQEFRLFDSIGYSVVAAAIVVYVFLYFHQLLSKVTEQDIFRDFNFWLTSGYLFYFLGSFIIFLTYHYFTAKIMATYTHEERYVLTNLWGVHNCLLFLGAATLLTGSLCIIYRRKSALS